LVSWLGYQLVIEGGREVLEAALAELIAALPQLPLPWLVHCSAGVDRTPLSRTSQSGRKLPPRQDTYSSPKEESLRGGESEIRKQIVKPAGTQVRFAATSGIGRHHCDKMFGNIFSACEG
jgi:hypothetical protein